MLNNWYSVVGQVYLHHYFDKHICLSSIRSIITKISSNQQIYKSCHVCFSDDKNVFRVIPRPPEIWILNGLFCRDFETAKLALTQNVTQVVKNEPYPYLKLPPPPLACLTCTVSQSGFHNVHFQAGPDLMFFFFFCWVTSQIFFSVLFSFDFWARISY